jgi:transcriptional regulator with XRE-family HTH domain
MSKAPLDPGSNDAVAHRLRALLDGRSQADVARKTGQLRNNVSRYARGAKIPIEFGAALVRGLGVNPAWLLLGEGAPFLSDVTATTVKAAEDLLELVEAMSAVARMQLGSLTGKHHLKVLRELSDALASYERLRQDLNTRTAPIFRQVLADYWKALEKWDFERADDLRKAASQVARLSDDEKLAAEFDRTRAYHAYLQHDEAQAIALQRRVFQRMLPASTLLDDRSLREAFNFATTLQGSSRMQEALRVCKGVLLMAPDESRGTPILRFISALCGFVEMELGDIRSGLARIQASFPQPDERMRPSQQSMLLHCLMYSGAISFEAACAMGPVSPAHSQGMLVRAMFEDTPQALELACKAFINSGPASLAENVHVCAYSRALLGALKGSGRKHAREFLTGALAKERESAKSETEKFDNALFTMRLCRALDDAQGFVHWMLEAARILDALPKEITVGLLGRTILWKNALLARDGKDAAVEALRKRAGATFKELFDKGYGSFESLAATGAA